MILRTRSLRLEIPPTRESFRGYRGRIPQILHFGKSRPTATAPRCAGGAPTVAPQAKIEYHTGRRIHLTHPPDYHVHTRFSCDSETEMATACEAAIARGLSEIAFAEHADFEPRDECCGFLRPAAYLSEIERCRRRYGDRLTIRAGVEVGEGHVYRDQAATLLQAHQFDFVLGSLHWVDGRLHCDGHYFAGRTLDEGLRAYFEQLAQLVAEADYDVLAHFDTVRRAAYRAFGPRTLGALRTLDYTPYEETIRRVLRTLVERGKGLEVNTVTYRRGMGDPSPPLQILRWYHELGGQIITLGSDAHTASAIGAHLTVALEMARAAGFTRLATFERRHVHWMNM